MASKSSSSQLKTQPPALQVWNTDYSEPMHAILDYDPSSSSRGKDGKGKGGKDGKGKGGKDGKGKGGKEGKKKDGGKVDKMAGAGPPSQWGPKISRCLRTSRRGTTRP